ncbi:hypothetical protein QTP88_008056 [Uroleucon formosanum]
MGLLRVPPCTENFGQSIIMCLIDRLTLHVSQVGFGSLLIRYEWVRWVCPILTRIASDVVILLIFVEDGDNIVSLAIVSTFSFPRIPTCEGTHMKEIFLMLLFRLRWSGNSQALHIILSIDLVLKAPVANLIPWLCTGSSDLSVLKLAEL